MRPQINEGEKETLLMGEIKLNAEGLEEVIAPGPGVNHNETLVSDRRS